MNKINMFNYLKTAGALRGSHDNPIAEFGTIPWPGSQFFVNSASANALDSTNRAEQGKSWDYPFATIDYAIGQCTANKGDVIYVAPYHQEVKAAAGDLFTLDVSGVSVIGVGNGAYHATVSAGVATYHNAPVLILDHASATITVSAANTRVSGFKIISDIADVAVALTVSAAADGAIIDNNVFNDNGAAVEYLVGISVAAAANYVQLLDNKFYTTISGGTNNAILLAGANTGLVIKGNFAYGKFATGCILGSTAAQVSAFIVGNTLINAEAAVAIALHTSGTGVMAGNLLGGTTSMAAALTGDNAFWCFENYISGAVAVSGVINPAVDAD